MAITKIPTRMLPATSAAAAGGGGGMPEEGEQGEQGFMGPPGPQGPAGAGATGAQGPTGPAVFMEAEPGQDGMDAVPGQTGQPGSNGATGEQGPIGPAVFLEAEPGEDGDVIPGPPGPTGATGATGASGSAALSYANAAASGAIGSGSSAENDFNKTFTVPLNTLAAGDAYRITIGIDGNNGATGKNHTLRVYLGTNKIYVPLNSLAPSGTGAFSGFATVLFTVRTTGSGGTVDSMGEWVITRNGSSQIPQCNNPTNGDAVVVDTTANAIAKVSYQFSGTNVATNVTLRHFFIEKLGTGT